MKREEPSKGEAVTCHFSAKCKEITLELWHLGGECNQFCLMQHLKTCHVVITSKARESLRRETSVI